MYRWVWFRMFTSCAYRTHSVAILLCRWKCVFIIKLNTSNVNSETRMKAYWNETYVCQNVEGKLKKGEQAKKRCHNKCKKYRSMVLTLGIGCWNSQWDIYHEFRCINWQRSVHRFHFIAFCVYHLWCRHTSLCLNQFSFNEKNISIISGTM